jgi:ketosteroid isomerase-like protein
VVGTLAAIAVHAEPQAGDEAAIRAAIERVRAGEDLRTQDAIFFSGAYKRPIVRGESKPEPTARAQTIVTGSERTTIRVRRIEVASGGDMAYEFSDGTIARRQKRAGGADEEVVFENSILRVWKKVGGQWRLAAHFSAPHGDK